MPQIGKSTGQETMAPETLQTSVPKQSIFKQLLEGIWPILKLLENASYAGGYTGADFAEILIYDTALSASDRQKIEGYLAHKWGLTGALSGSHPFKPISPPQWACRTMQSASKERPLQALPDLGPVMCLILTPQPTYPCIKVNVRKGQRIPLQRVRKAPAAYEEILYRPSVLKESNLALFFPLERG